MERMTTRMRKIMRSGRLPYGTGAYDGLTAKLVEEAGFDFVSPAGSQIAASHGLPDHELYSMTENLLATRRIVSSVEIPVIADCDTGYGNAVNVMRTVREFEQIGVAGILLEDQIAPKRCPAMGDPEILPLDVAVGKIRAAVSARKDPDLVIVARTDSTSVDEACARVKAFAEAGADMVFTINRCASSAADLRRIRNAAGVPILLAVGGWTEDLTEAERAEVAGAAFFVFPTLMTVISSLRTNLAAMRSSLDSRRLPLPQATLDDIKAITGFEKVERLQREFIPSAQ